MKNILFFILALGLFACKHDPNPIQPPTGCGMTIDQFPLKVGNSWTYEEWQSAGDFGETNLQLIDTLYMTIVDLKVENLDDTIFFIAYYSVKEGDTTFNSNYTVGFRKYKNTIKPFLSKEFGGSYNLLEFPLICNNIDTIINFKEEDPLYSIINVANVAIKDTIVSIKNINLNTVKCLKYFKTKTSFEQHYEYENKSQYYYISPNIGLVIIYTTGTYVYPYSTTFNNYLKLIDYKLI